MTRMPESGLVITLSAGRPTRAAKPRLYCPEHARFSTAPAADLVPPRPTATARDGAGNPLNRDEYAERLREQLADGGRSAGPTLVLTAAQAAVAARLLDELAGVYRGESLGLLARELSALLDGRHGDRG